MSVNKDKKRKTLGLDQAKIMSLIKLVMVFVVLVLVLFLLVRILRDHFQTDSNLSGLSTNNEIAASIEGDSVLDMQALNSGIVVLTNNNLLFLDSSGSLVRNSEHNFDSPAISVGKSNVLLYDRSHTNYKIEKRTGTIYEGETDKTIICGSITPRNGYALATRAEDATSQLLVYNSNFKEKFRWTCAGEHIVDIDLADNNKQAAVAVLGSKDAVLYSKVHLFNFRYAERFAVFDFDDDSVFSVKYTGRNRAVVYAPSGVYLLSGEEKEQMIDLKSFDPRYIDYSENNRSAFISTKYGSYYANDLYAFDKKAKELFTLPIHENIKGLSASASGVSLMLNDRIETYNYKGERIGSVTHEADALDLVSVSGRLYVLSSLGIYVYKADSFREKTTDLPEQTSEENIENIQ